MMSPSRWLSVAIVAAISASCGGDEGGSTGPTPPDPGPLNLVLATPNVDDGMILISISGGTVTAVQGSGYQVVSSGLTGSAVEVLARGSLTNGVFGTITVPDRNLQSAYKIKVEQVASRQTYVQRPVSGYTLSLVRP